MTRQWYGVHPSEMCPNHLLGEHKEIHDMVGYMKSGHVEKLAHHAARGQIDTSRAFVRHGSLATEMSGRGYDHDSPMTYEFPVHFTTEVPRHRIEVHNRLVLDERCDDCSVLRPSTFYASDS